MMVPSFNCCACHFISSSCCFYWSRVWSYWWAWASFHILEDFSDDTLPFLDDTLALNEEISGLNKGNFDLTECVVVFTAELVHTRLLLTLLLLLLCCWPLVKFFVLLANLLIKPIDLPIGADLECATLATREAWWYPKQLDQPIRLCQPNLSSIQTHVIHRGPKTAAPQTKLEVSIKLLFLYLSTPYSIKYTSYLMSENFNYGFPSSRLTT